MAMGGAEGRFRIDKHNEPVRALGGLDKHDTTQEQRPSTRMAPSTQCAVCFEDSLAPEQIWRCSGCPESVGCCTECMNGFVSARIDDGASKIVCPVNYLGCGNEVSPSELKRLLRPEVFERCACTLGDNRYLSPLLRMLTNHVCGARATAIAAGIPTYLKSTSNQTKLPALMPNRPRHAQSAKRRSPCLASQIDKRMI